MDWQTFEKEVIKIAESVWSTNCQPEYISGVRCDAVLKIRPDYYVIIEISKRSDLQKLREDASKLSSVRLSLIQNGIFCECIFVTMNEESSLKETANSLNIKTYDFNSFATHFIGTRQYKYERGIHPFGSAVDPETGTSDTKIYTSINYIDKIGNRYSIRDISDLLYSGKKIILLGEFGTGKSRCAKEVFNHLCSNQSAFLPIAINLRDNWGYKKLDHILRNHLDELGLSKFSDSLVRTVRRSYHPLILDGFDEIGSQSWSGDPTKLSETRRKSLEGVRDIISSCPTAGILITGREHYFNSDDEMLSCLGILGEVIIVKCPDEFSEMEANYYIRANTELNSIPDWMPKKPLICQLLAKLEPSELEMLNNNISGEVDFFESVFDAICQRETRINASVDKDTMKKILLRISQITRLKYEKEERLSTAEINTAFYDVTGHAPIDESSILLQRLPYLGRVGSNSSDRIFIDDYAKDGLRGLALADSFAMNNKDIQKQKWRQSLKRFGLMIFSSKIAAGSTANKYARACLNHGNNQAVADYICLKINQCDEFCDLESIIIDDAEFESLDLSEILVKNCTLSSCNIENIIIDNTKFESFIIDNCTIGTIFGVGSTSKLPDVFHKNCIIGKIDSAESSARISELNLTNGKKTLLSLIKKLFFQRGAGRQEEALLRGGDAYWDRGVADKAIGYMLSNGIVEMTRGAHGKLYLPQRRHTKRMARILEMQNSCDDDLWSIVS